MPKSLVRIGPAIRRLAVQQTLLQTDLNIGRICQPLHAKPYARFNATWSAGSTWAAGSKDCSRELADALFVLYETAPIPGQRRHQVVRRSACMLVFKRDHTAWPSTPTFEPGAHPLPMKRGSSDKEQFYLYNKWPNFRLEEGPMKAPMFSHHFDLTGTVPHDIGKYALVWDGKLKERWAIWRAPTLPSPTSWIYARPESNFSIYTGMLSDDSGSLGYLLERFIEGVVGHGRDFMPPSATRGGTAAPMGWDELMAFLLGYPLMGPFGREHKGHLSSGHYYGKKNSRDINPAKNQFISFTGDALEYDAMRLGTLHQIRHELDASPGVEAHNWPNQVLQRSGRPQLDKGVLFTRRARYGRDAGSNDRLPILVATINHLTPLDLMPRTHP